MKLPLLDTKAASQGETVLPSQFKEAYRPDLIKRAIQALQSLLRQPYGADPRAGMRHSAEVSRRRRKYRGSYGQGISRVPRKILSRRGTRFNWTGAQSPGTVGGRRAHPPKVEKKWEKKMNNKEQRKAMRSALSASIDPKLLKERHLLPKQFPFAFTKDIEQVDKTKDLKNTLESVGLKEELQRVNTKTVRAGKGTMRGRKYKKKTGPLLVVSQDCAVKKITSLEGIDVVDVHTLTAHDLAPGNMPRLTIYSQNALKAMEEEKMFL